MNVPILRSTKLTVTPTLYALTQSLRSLVDVAQDLQMYPIGMVNCLVANASLVSSLNKCIR